jgi:DnaJ-related protein SCJ1
MVDLDLISGFIQKISKQGMPKHMYPDERGDLFVEYSVILPATLTDSQKTGNY